MNIKITRASQKGRWFLGFFCTQLMAVLLVFSPITYAQNTSETIDRSNVPNPGSDLWRSVRQREGKVSGVTQARGVDAGTLISPNGEKFQDFRRNEIIKKGKWVLAGVVVILIVFFLLNGRTRIKNGVTGEKILRFDTYKRVLHWVMSGLFIFLAITGLILMFGRFFLLPWMGSETFAVIASASKEGHNLFGPLFLLSLFMFLFSYACRNIPRWVDTKWMLQLGGLFSKSHPSAGFFNGGEKVWFWLVIMIGLLISVTGLVLVFAVLGQGRELMQLSLIVHGIAAIFLIGGALGHIYMSFAIEGAMDSMTTGYVEKNWAKEHHNLWADEMESSGKILSENELSRTQGTVIKSNSASEA